MHGDRAGCVFKRRPSTTKCSGLTIKRGERWWNESGACQGAPRTLAWICDQSIGWVYGLESTRLQREIEIRRQVEPSLALM